MKTQQYQQFNHDNTSSSNTVGITNLIALRGLHELADVEFLKNFVNKEFVSVSGLKALDLNAGSGAAAITLAGLGFQVAAFDVYRKSIAIIQQLALQQELDIGFGMSGKLQVEKCNEKWALVHDRSHLAGLIQSSERQAFLQGLRNILDEDGCLVLKTEVLSSEYDPRSGFESLRLDSQHTLWRETPACDVPGVIEAEGRHWTAMKKLLPVESLRTELAEAGLQIISEEVVAGSEDRPAAVRFVLKAANA